MLANGIYLTGSTLLLHNAYQRTNTKIIAHIHVFKSKRKLHKSNSKRIQMSAVYIKSSTKSYQNRKYHLEMLT